jgi:hypothetical protein
MHARGTSLLAEIAYHLSSIVFQRPDSSFAFYACRSISYELHVILGMKYISGFSDSLGMIAKHAFRHSSPTHVSAPSNLLARRSTILGHVFFGGAVLRGARGDVSFDLCKGTRPRLVSSCVTIVDTPGEQVRSCLLSASRSVLSKDRRANATSDAKLPPTRDLLLPILFFLPPSHASGRYLCRPFGWDRPHPPALRRFCLRLYFFYSGHRVRCSAVATTSCPGLSTIPHMPCDDYRGRSVTGNSGTEACRLFA